MASATALERGVSRDRIVISAAVALLLAVSWAVLAYHGADYTHALTPHSASPTFAGFALAFLMWMVMMTAMMLPSVMPWITLFASTSRRSDAEAEPLVSTGLFVSGYFAIWGAYSAGAAFAQLLLQRGAQLPLAPYVGGALLLSAGAFQLTPIKAACLRHCRSPLGFFLSQWRDGPVGAFQMGFRHGTYCLGCCWALMALSFALGVMNLLWMAALTLLLCVEKLAPGGQTVSRVFGVVLAAWGVWLLAL